MSKQISDAYIVAATRTPIGKSHRGYFKNTRPDDLLVAALQGALKQVPNLDPKSIDYRVDGPEGDGDRPKEFASKAGSQAMNLVFEKVKDK